LKLVAGLFALMLAIGLASLVLWRSSAESVPCESRDVSHFRSPDGRSEADVFELHCGPSVTTHVALRSSMTAPKSRVDVFVAEDQVPVQVIWTSPRELLVQSPSARVLVAETRWRDVSVKLRPQQ
jgi:hypothetical protein